MKRLIVIILLFLPLSALSSDESECKSVSSKVDVCSFVKKLSGKFSEIVPTTSENGSEVVTAVEHSVNSLIFHMLIKLTESDVEDILSIEDITLEEYKESIGDTWKKKSMCPKNISSIDYSGRRGTLFGQAS